MKRAAETGPEDEFLSTDFDAAREYISKHPEYALCRVRHDVRFHEPPVDMEYHSDGGKTHIYICHGCESTYFRRYWADGRFHSGKWKYSEGYIAEKGTGYALIGRSGKAAFNLALDETMANAVRRPKARKR